MITYRNKCEEGCMLKDMCKYYGQLNDGKVVRIVTSCKFYQSNGKTSPLIPKAAYEQLPPRADIFERMKTIDKEIREVRKVEAGQADDDIKIIQATKGNKCELCGVEGTQLIECSKCGKKVCGDCMYDRLDGSVVCEECFDSGEDDVSLGEIK